MKEKKLACCVVRDLLPSYIEGLTEDGTAEMVQEHLESCPECRRIEQDMRHTVPVARSPGRELKFLRRFKRTRLIAAALALIVALGCMWWLYDREFHYPNTDAGRLAAVEDYIPLPAGSSMAYGVKAGTPMHVGGWEARGNHLFIFYFADNGKNVHGTVHLVRGINGKYRILESDETPSAFSGGVYGEALRPRGTDLDLFYLAGYNCREIYRAEVEFIGVSRDGEARYSTVRSLELSGENFLELMDRETLEDELGLGDKDLIHLYVENVKLFDKDGKDITGEYRDASATEAWGGGKTAAETFLLYVYIGIAALLGVLFIRYFLRRD